MDRYVLNNYRKKGFFGEGIKAFNKREGRSGKAEDTGDDER